MQLAARHRFLIAWFLLGTLAAGVCSLVWPAAHLREEVIPVGNDSFYHARRILDVAHDPASFYEFDPRIHAPEGSLLAWPWGYDYAMGWLVRTLAGSSGAEPIEILVWLPVAAVCISIGLIMLIARRMGLSLWFSSLAALCVALSPLTQYLHGVGFVDHHFAEYMLVLASVLLGLMWLERPDSTRRAALLGVTLGLAPAIHNALFILQLPLLLTLFVRWWQGVAAPQHSTGVFTAALLAATLAAITPSLAWRAGMFEYFLLSWFHLYVAAATALCSMFFSRWAWTRTSLAVLIGGATLLLLPLTFQVIQAKAFLAGDVLRLDAIAEMQSPWAMLQQTGPGNISNRYSLLIWLLPLTLCYCGFRLWRDRRSPRLLYWIGAILGLALLTLQFRLHYFGTFALCIPWLVAVQELMKQHLCSRPQLLPVATSAVVVLMLAPPLRGQLLGPMVPGNDPSFINIHHSLQVLAEACRTDPGVVLADNNAGHYIRYYTECSVITNNFLLTAQDESKIREMERLFSTSAGELALAAPFVKYILVRPMMVSLTERGVTYVSYSGDVGTLIADLLLRPHATPPILPPSNFELLYATNMVDTSNIEVPYLVLYKMRREAAMAQRSERGSF